MLDSALVKAFPDIFTPLEMLTTPPGMRTPAKLDLLGQPLLDEPTTSTHRIEEEIHQRVFWLSRRPLKWENTCTHGHFLLREQDANIQELRRKLADDGEVIKGYEWTEATLR